MLQCEHNGPNVFPISFLESTSNLQKKGKQQQQLQQPKKNFSRV